MSGILIMMGYVQKTNSFRSVAVVRLLLLVGVAAGVGLVMLLFLLLLFGSDLQASFWQFTLS